MVNGIWFGNPDTAAVTIAVFNIILRDLRPDEVSAGTTQIDLLYNCYHTHLKFVKGYGKTGLIWELHTIIYKN